MSFSATFSRKLPEKCISYNITDNVVYCFFLQHAGGCGRSFRTGNRRHKKWRHLENVKIDRERLCSVRM